MTSSALKVDASLLDDLLNNQQKLDDIFLNQDSDDFGEDSFFSAPMTFDDDEYSIGSHSQNESFEVAGFSSDDDDDDDFSMDFDDSTSGRKITSTTSIAVAVVVELAVIYYGIMYFM